MPSDPTSLLFFFTDTATTQIYTLSLHDALPIFASSGYVVLKVRIFSTTTARASSSPRRHASAKASIRLARSEEHTSELQSHVNLVCRLLLEKKNTLPCR